MDEYVRGSIVVGVLAALVWGEVQGEYHPHAEFVVPSTSNMLAASGAGPMVSNVSASTVTISYQAAPQTLEQILPHDHLVIQNVALVPPTPAQILIGPRTGANPFFLQRRRPTAIKVRYLDVKPFWCASFQQFRSRMMTRARA